MAPAVPVVSTINRTSTPNSKLSEMTTEDSRDIQGDDPASLLVKKQRNEASEISLGSPKSKGARQKSEAAKVQNLIEKVDEKLLKKAELPTAMKADNTKGKGRAAGERTEKIELPSAPALADVSSGSSVLAVPDKPATPILDSAVVGTPGTMSSRPATPGTTTPSEASKTSVPRPRTLRLTTSMTTKTTEPTPASATTEKSGILPPNLGTKKGSRRPSLSSAQHSRPSTPAMSERPSHDASRASSPPPSIVGSAPERVRSKNQQKKERREKAKKTTDVSEASTPNATVPVTEEVAPVIARQKKQKKRVESNVLANTGGTAPKQADKSAPADEVADDKAEEMHKKLDAEESAKNSEWRGHEKDGVTPGSTKTENTAAVQSSKPSTPLPGTPNEDSGPKPEDLKTSYTLRDLYNEAGKLSGNVDSSSAVQKLLNEHISTMPKIISSMIQSGDLSKDHPWLHPPSLSSAAYKLPPDSRRGQDYLDGNGYSANDAFGYIYLPLKEKQALKDGNAVSVADAGERKDDLLKRCLVTPNGWVLRHLSAEDSEKVLEFEERRQMYLEEFGDVGTMDGLGVLEADDYTNLGGGMERLARQGARHGVVWIMGDRGEGDEDDEFEPFDDEDVEIDGEIGIRTSDFAEVSDFDDEDVDEVDGDGLGLNDSVSMPGAWELRSPSPHHAAGGGSAQGDSRFNSLPGLGPYSKTNALRSEKGPTIGPELLSGNRSSSTANANANPTSPAAAVNLRALDSETLQKRVVEKQKELEASRKDMEKIEKLWNKKSKDIGRWREGLVAGLSLKG